jgi:transposase-like protein
MKRKPYTVQEKEELLKSDAIEKIANSSATYLKEFKLFAVGEYMAGKTPMQIFLEAGINVNILGREQPQKCLQRWRKIHNTYGPEALLNENRGLFSTGRPSKKVLTTEEKLAKLERENEILQQQVQFLKKLRGWE